MYISKALPDEGAQSAWIEASLRIGDCFDVILRNKADACAPAFAALERYDIRLPEETFVLMQFDTAELWMADLLLQQRSTRLIDQIFAIFGGVFDMHLFTSEGSLYGLLMLPLEFNGERFQWQITNCSHRLMETVPDHSLHILISQDEQGRQGIFHAANSLRYGLDFLRFFDESPRITFLELWRQTALDDGADFSAYLSISASLAERLGDDSFSPRQAAEAVIRTLRSHSACSIESLHRQMQSFSVTFINHLLSRALVDKAFLRRIQLSRRIMEGDSERAYVENLAKLLSELHQQRQMLIARFNTQRLERVHAYVEQHIDSMDLSVSQIAEHFSLNRSQLTAQFRAYFGQSLAEFIHSARLSRAMLLIESHPGRPIEQIAQEAGYCSLSTMYRAFQRSGVGTPAQYRAQRNNLSSSR